MSFYVASKTLSGFYTTEDGLVASPELGGLPSEVESRVEPWHNNNSKCEQEKSKVLTHNVRAVPGEYFKNKNIS